MKNQTLFSILFSSTFILSCAQQNNYSKEDIEKAKTEIRKTEEAFCDLSVKEGFNHALIAYADSEVIKPSDGENPVYGLEDLKTTLSGQKENGVITWKATKIDVANSCDFGYSFGNWEYKTATEKGDTTYFGNYFTEWKKQKDGSWKYVLDGGNDTPKPE